MSRTFEMSENPLQIVALERNPLRVHQIPIFFPLLTAAPRKKLKQIRNSLILISLHLSLIEYWGRTLPHVLPRRYRLIMIPFFSDESCMTEPPDSLVSFLSKRFINIFREAPIPKPLQPHFDDELFSHIRALFVISCVLWGG